MSSLMALFVLIDHPIVSLGLSDNVVASILFNLKKTLDIKASATSASGA